MQKAKLHIKMQIAIVREPFGYAPPTTAFEGRQGKLRGRINLYF